MSLKSMHPYFDPKDALGNYLERLLKVAVCDEAGYLNDGVMVWIQSCMYSILEKGEAADR